MGLCSGPCADDGNFVYYTLVAVQNYQAKQGIFADEIVGQQTLSAILK